jgi:Rieske 2Fe-2S family protein
VLQATLPYRVYLDDEVWQDERERLFARQWFQVCRVEDLPAVGCWRRVDVAGEQVLVVQGEDRLRAFANTCRHRGAELCPADGPVTGQVGRTLRCPYHHWTYDLDGRLLAAPHLDEMPEVALYAVAVDSWGGFVFACLSPDGAPTLEEQIGRAAERATAWMV